jgi:hypothetical protein
MKLQIQCEEEEIVQTLGDMENALNAIHNHSDSSRPVIATIEYPYDCRVDVGLGDEESIIIIWPQWHSEKADTYHVSLAAQPRIGTKWFWLHGTADTEFDSKYLIPIDLAMRIVREFVQTGNRPDAIKWATEYY